MPGVYYFPRKSCIGFIKYVVSSRANAVGPIWMCAVCIVL